MRDRVVRFGLGVGLFLCLVLGLLYAWFVVMSSFLPVFNTGAVWAIPAVVFSAFFFGLTREPEESRMCGGRILRHGVGVFLEHWCHAIGFIVLAVSGLLLGFRSYLLGDFFVNYLFVPRIVVSPFDVNFLFGVHFVGVLFFLFAIVYHVSYNLKVGNRRILPRRGDVWKSVLEGLELLGFAESPEEGKYEAVERLEYVIWALIVGFLLVSGLVKVFAHIWFGLPASLLEVSTVLHDTFALIGVVLLVVHVVTAALIPSSWPFFKSMVTGWMSEEHAKKEHKLWYEENKKK